MIKKILQYSGLLLLLVAFTVESADAQWRKKKGNDGEEEVEISVYDMETLIEPIPIQRALWHENKIDESQKTADASDGIVDGVIAVEDDTIFTRLLTDAILHDVNKMQILVENLPMDSFLIDSTSYKSAAQQLHDQKLIYLRALHDLVRRFNADPAPKGYYYKRLTNNMRQVIIADFKGELSWFVRNNISMYTLRNINELLDPQSQDRYFIYAEMAKREPEAMIEKLSDFATHPYACEIIREAAKVVPNMVFNFATSTTQTRFVVESCNDRLVQTIVRIARQSKSPLRAMPFLNDIYNGKKTISEIDVITANEDLFYQNLVRLKLEGVTLGGDTYTSELQYRGMRYIREMNDLHEEKAPVRFKCINGMSPEVLYFIMVYGQDEIYTSSFLGTFQRMMERMSPLPGDKLLEKVHRDKFRTFIRMCAGYNVLSEFLGTMEQAQRTSLMRDFIAGLDKGKEDDLEDAVDVADAFGSIKDPELTKFLTNEVKKNYEQSYRTGSKKGVIVYGLLATLFNSATQEDDDDNSNGVSGRLGLPPINLVPYNKLTDKEGKVYEQYFFYGDEDGRASYNSWLTNFRDKAKWTIEKSTYWTKITSLQGKPMIVYANMPLEEPEDEVAIDTLCKYLVESKIQPTVMVHRGHSYHLPLTLERLQKETKIVLLGSCGGYHNLSTVLTKAPNANIISSKQTGAMSVNEPIIKSINDQISEGKDINWISTWRGLTGYFDQRKGPQKEMFDDYVPPHKNLGAIFIKAYRRMFNADM
ncbi:MAG: hypothetical protein KDC11_06975 [Chitinophagaceae bacterium]|nr:hypothetical protein [Chitinophagaceae bacterium]